MILAELDRRARDAGLFVSGTCDLAPGDGLPPRFRSVALLSPDEPRFWDIFTASPESVDGVADPVDRWSRRVIGTIACAMGGKAAFPFGGPPYRPFVRWALRSGRCHNSPVHLLVHDTAGLFISFRGAVALSETLPPDPRPAPCDTCARPCTTACPPGALTPAGYDVPACHAWLDLLPPSSSPITPGEAIVAPLVQETMAAGAAPRGQRQTDDCRSGCLVRRACPVGQERRRPEQSAHHMRHFHR
jgi:epoxyqueuosine reductase